MTDRDRDDDVRARTTAADVANVPQRYQQNVKLSTLREFPGNPKTHDVDALVDLMKANGRYGVVYAQKGSRRLLAGHGRKKAYKRLGLKTVDVVWLDVNDTVAARIVAADNRSVELGGYDDVALLAFLRQLASDDDGLLGTGYADDDIARLAYELETPSFLPATSDDQGQLDRQKMIVCPSCGHEFKP
jgi:ParB-like chromosome segregation protein Spo0J